jgi:hypothetical protein
LGSFTNNEVTSVSINSSEIFEENENKPDAAAQTKKTTIIDVHANEMQRKDN